MKYSSVFRLSLLALLLAGCGEDDAGTTAWTRPEEPAAAGNPVVCRLSIDDGDESPEAETRTAYGPLTNGSWPIYWRSGDRVEVISPQTTPQRATVEVRVSGATESEADLSDTGMAWGEGLHDFTPSIPPGRSGPMPVRSSWRRSLPSRPATTGSATCSMPACRPAPRMWPKARWFRLHSVR